MSEQFIQTIDGRFLNLRHIDIVNEDGYATLAGDHEFKARLIHNEFEDAINHPVIIPAGQNVTAIIVAADRTETGEIIGRVVADEIPVIAWRIYSGHSGDALPVLPIVDDIDERLEVVALRIGQKFFHDNRQFATINDLMRFAEERAAPVYEALDRASARLGAAA